jgi:hypothetical protein
VWREYKREVLKFLLYKLEFRLHRILKVSDGHSSLLRTHEPPSKILEKPSPSSF